MNYSFIEFILNQKLEQDLALEFYNNPNHGGSDFWQERAIKYHPKLKEIESVKNPKKFLNKYISEYYIANKKEIDFLSNEVRKNFKDKETAYFLLVNKIFGGYPWPKNKYIGYFSIFDFCPRFLDSGEFQVFIYDNKENQLFTIFHEMLHFIFYDYAQKTFPEILGNIDTDSGVFWDLAEMFNTVIQSTEEFIELHGEINNMGYPDHNLILPKAKEIWSEEKNIFNWIDQMIRILEIK